MIARTQFIATKERANDHDLSIVEGIATAAELLKTGT
jgi:hypothetical protein